jgi:hypothetical protein
MLFENLAKAFQKFRREYHSPTPGMDRDVEGVLVAVSSTTSDADPSVWTMVIE